MLLESFLDEMEKISAEKRAFITGAVNFAVRGARGAKEQKA